MTQSLQERVFHPTRLDEPVVIVVPDDLVDDKQMRRLADACTAPILPQEAFDNSAFAEAHVITCGHLANNKAIERLYNGRHCFVDTLFPGGDDYLVRSINDPFGSGHNAIVAGASSVAGLERAVTALTDQIAASHDVVDRVHAHRLEESPQRPNRSSVDELIAKDLAMWHGGWVASPFRGGKLKSYLWHQYLDDDKIWGRLISGIFSGSMELWLDQRRREPSAYHDFFHLDQFIHLWDLVEDHPAYSPTDRQAVVEMFSELLRHLAGLFYLREEVNPDGMPRQNHATFIALNLAAGHEYLSRRYGITEFAQISERVERIFAGQALGYKPNDDGGVGYVWHTPRHTLDYWLRRDDYRYLDDGHVSDLCRLLAITTDNLRSEVGYGDSSGYTAFERAGWQAHLWPMLASVWRNKNPEHLWLLNWLAQDKMPGIDHALESWHASVLHTDGGFSVPGIESALPEDLLGVTALPLSDSVLRLVAHGAPTAHQPDGKSRYFDKLSVRPGFDADEEYLLLEGIGTLCHGHEDTNAILRLSWKGRAWLVDGDYIRAAPKFHNSVTVQRDGVGVLESPGDGLVIPPLARLLTEHSHSDGGTVQSEVVGYNGVDWRRNLIWRRGRYIAVVDEMRCTEAGEFSCRCLWRVVGDVTQTQELVGLRQGDVQLFVHNADGSVREIVDDGAVWGGYPHHDGHVHVVHQKTSRRLKVGESIVFLHLFTPHDSVSVQPCGQSRMRILDGEETRIVGVGEDGSVIDVVGDDIEPGKDVAPGDDVERAELLSPSVKAGESAAGISTGEIKPGKIKRAEIAQSTLAKACWQRSIVDSAGPIALFDDEDDSRLIVADAEGGLICASLDDGSEIWRVTLPSPASVLRTADIDGDGTAEVLVGMTAAEFSVLDGATGTERWRQPLKNLYDSKAAATVVRVADLEGDGQLSVLVGTAGWFVNVFTTDGTPKWAQWFRYHVITAVEAADVDGDGRAEVIVGNTYSTPLNVHEFDGTFRWSTLEQVGAEGNATTPRRGIGLTQLRLSDLDGDGRQEIIYGTEDGWLFAVDPLAGEEIWQHNVVGKVVGLEVTQTGVIAANEFGDVYVLSKSGEITTHRHVSEWIRETTRSADGMLLAIEGGDVLQLDASGLVTGSQRVPSEIRQLHADPRRIVCLLDDGTICVSEIA